MNRRNAIFAIPALGSVSLAVLAQPTGKVSRIGFLSVRSAPTSVAADPLYKSFIDGLRDLGYVEGRNLAIEWRFGDGKFERMLELAADLVSKKVDVIVTHAQGTLAAQKATATIPIVSAVMIEDPVIAGFAKSLGRPGKNITGTYPYSTEFVAKFLELIMAATPKATRIAVLMNPDNPSHAIFFKAIQVAAHTRAISVVAMNARSPRELEASYSRMKREQATAAIILPDGFYLQHVKQLAALAIEHRVPSIWGGRQYTDAGGLMSYGFQTNGYRHAATFVDKITKGAHPGDLPIEQGMRFHFAINLKAARSLGMVLPQDLLLLADEAIE